MADDHLDKSLVFNYLEEFAFRYVYRLTSFMKFRLMASSKIADSGFFYNSISNCLKCTSCDFEINLSDERFVEDFVKFHRVKSHGEVEELAELEVWI